MRRWVPPELLLVAGLVSACTFVGVMLFGPERRPPAPTAGSGPRDSQPARQRPPFGTVVRELWATGQIDRAAEASARVAARAPWSPEPLLFHALSLERLGRTEDAAEVWMALRALAEPADGHQATDPDAFAPPVGDYFFAWALLRTGEPGRAKALFAAEGERAASFEDHYNAACYLAMAGRLDEAAAHWTRAVDTGLRTDLAWAAVDPDLDPIRTHPDFIRAFERARARELIGGLLAPAPPVD